jgi:MFS superfamily sulfate permease-like transporter/CRP-like cAMP-binding protein
MTTPLLGGGAAAAVLGGGGGPSRRASFERERPPSHLFGASPLGAATAAAAHAAAATMMPTSPPAPPLYSLAQAQAQAAHDPVVAAAIADTAAELAQREQEEQEEEQFAAANASTKAARPRSPSFPSAGRLSSLFSSPTAQTDAIYGLINAVVGIPTMVSFAAIVFAHPTYKPFLGKLARFSFLSAAAHQLVFALLSTLPFAVGQPQDTGLIVLSAIATSVADYGLERALSARVVLATALVTLSVATLIVGLLTMVVARLKLAGLVQFVPLPVVGGYLSFVGWFCLTAGLGLGTGAEVTGSPASWAALLASWDVAQKLGATLLAAGAMLVCMRRARSPWALPVLLMCIPLVFHAVLLASGSTLAQAQDAGWVIKPPGSGGGEGGGGAGGSHGGHGGHGGGGADPPSSSSSSSSQLEPFWDLYRLFFSGAGIALPAMLRQLPRVLALWLVVVFGSTLDVAAIQACSPAPLDFDAELGTVGVSNVLNGLIGAGYSGSYIFSQTIFSMRAGVSGPLHGLVLGLVELLVFLLPVPVVQYLPNFFFGALLVVFGVEIAGDWLVHSRAKVTRAEYALLLLTFALVVQLGLEKGVAAGAIACLLYFAYAYSRVHVSAFRAAASRSAAARPLREHRALEGAFGGRMAAVSLSGYVFFGSAIKIMDRVLAFAREEMVLEEEEEEEAEEARAAAGASGSGGHGASSNNEALLRRVAKTAPRFLLLDFRRVLGVDATAAQTFGTLRMQLRRLGVELVLTRVRGNPTVERLFAAHGLIAPVAEDDEDDGGGGGGGQRRSKEGVVVVSDGGEAVSAGQDEQGEHDDDAVDPSSSSASPYPYCRAFDTLNDGCLYCEERLLALARAAGALPAQDVALTLREFLSGHLMVGDGGAQEDEEDEEVEQGGDGGKGKAPTSPTVNAPDNRASFGFAALGGSRRAADEAARGIEEHSTVARFSPGDVLFDYGAAPDVVYLVLRGAVDVEVHGEGAAAAMATGVVRGGVGGSRNGRNTSGATPAAAALEAAAASFPRGAGGPAPMTGGGGSSGTSNARRHYQCGVGAVVGGTDAVLQRPRAYRAVAASAVEAVAVASRGYRRMARERPAAARALQAILLRDACLSEVYAYEALRRAAD